MFCRRKMENIYTVFAFLPSFVFNIEYVDDVVKQTSTKGLNYFRAKYKATPHYIFDNGCLISIITYNFYVFISK